MTRASAVRPPQKLAAACLFAALSLDGTGWALEADGPDATARKPLREMITDAFVETPHTVDAGHLQIETSLLDYTRDRGEGLEVRTLLLAATLLKLGLSRRAELQVLVQPFARVRTTELAAGGRETAEGFGDVTPRLKLNVFGNDGGRAALAVASFVKLPTHRNGLGEDAFEGGVSLPFAVGLSDNWSLGLTSRADLLGGAGRTRRRVEWTQALGLYRALGRWEAYSELVGRRGQRAWDGQLNVGLIYLLSDNVQLDAEVVFGLTPRADDFNHFFGISWRF